MRTLVLVLALTASALFLGQPAQCLEPIGYCANIQCMSSAGCGLGCTCFVPPGEHWGKCWGTE